MKIISLRLYKKHLKGASFVTPRDCPIARAMIDRGYTNVSVFPISIRATKGGRNVFFEILNGGGKHKNIGPAIRNLTPLSIKIREIR